MVVVIETVERVSKLCLCSCTLKFSDFMADIHLSYAASVMQLSCLVSRDNGRPLFQRLLITSTSGMGRSAPTTCSYMKVAKTRIK